MSLTIDKLKVRRVVDPRVDVNSADRKVYACFDGASQVGYIRAFPDGSVNNTSMTYSINPPSAKVFVNRRPLLSTTFDITFTGTSAGVGIPLLQCAGLPSSPGVSSGTAHYDAPRCQPLASSITSLQVSMNNDRLSQNLNTYSRAVYQRYANEVHQQDSMQSLTPSMVDQSMAYSDLNGYARSPLRGYGDNPLQCPRGGWSQCIVLRNDSTGTSADVAIIRMTATEFLLLSPFLSAENDQDVGFIGVQTMSITTTLGGRGNSALSGLASSLWSHSTGGSALTSAIANVVESSVLFSYLTPDATQVIPELNNYPYYEPTCYPTTSVASVPAGVSTTLQMNNIQLNSIPSCIFVFAAPVDSSNNITSTDTYFNISGINVSFDNNDSLLANASEYDLFTIAQKNNCNLSWEQWHTRCGSVLKLCFGSDIPLKSLQAVGLRGSYNLRMSVVVKNLYAQTHVPTLTVLVVSEGVMTIHNGNVTRNIGVLDEQDVLNSKMQDAVVYRSDGSLFGGAWYDTLWSGIKSVARPLVDVGKAVSGVIAPQYGPAFGIADKALGALGGGLVGGAMVGGKRLTKRQLHSMLR